MGLRHGLARWGLARPRVLIFATPGAWQLRWHVEAELDRRRWWTADTPANADLLVVLGDPGPDLIPAADLLFDQMPSPKARTQIAHPDGVQRRLVDAAAALHDWDRQAAQLEDAPADPLDRPFALPKGVKAAAHGGGHERMQHGGGGHEQMGHGGGHEQMQHGGGGHEHTHHGGEVAGLPMASTAPDRDGLELDALQVNLGPWLPGWPTGLVVQGTVQGDVLTQPRLSWLGAESADANSPAADVAALDVLAGFLLVTGWPRAAAEARAARTALLRDGRNGTVLPARLAHRVSRSRTLSWSVRGLGAGPDGDVLDRVHRWCRLAADPTGDPPPPPMLDDLATLLDGIELAAARLVVASVAPRPLPARQPVDARYG